MLELRGGHFTEDPRLDRLVRYDEASRGFQVRELLDAGGVQRQLVWSKPGPTLDQGNSGACTGFSTATCLNTSPHAKRPRFTNNDARQLYFAAQRDDDWPGGEYPGASPVYSGSSVLGAMKAAKEYGYITGYRWVGAGSGKAVDDLVDSLRFVRSVVIGSKWLKSMFTPQPNGLIEVAPDSGVAGGHAYNAVAAVNTKLPGTAKRKLYVVIHQTWGRWGVGFRGVDTGFGYLDVEAGGVEWLLENDGEGAVPIAA